MADKSKDSGYRAKKTEGKDDNWQPLSVSDNVFKSAIDGAASIGINAKEDSMTERTRRKIKERTGQ